MVSPFQDKDPKKYIQNSIGVVTITGSTALEAAFYGKPSIIFGSTSFELLSCVNRLTDVTKMKDIISRWIQGKLYISDHELVAYIEAVFAYGQNILLENLLLYNLENTDNFNEKLEKEALKIKKVLEIKL